jgi:hypothetical protein
MADNKNEIRNENSCFGESFDIDVEVESVILAKKENALNNHFTSLFAEMRK